MRERRAAPTTRGAGTAPPADLRRPPCGDNPVLWKELHTERPRGFAQVLGVAISSGLAALIGYGTYRFARPAFLEWFGTGSAPRPRTSSGTGSTSSSASSLRWVEFFTLLIAAGVAAEGVTAERARQTWDGLIATPMDGRAILRAKMIGAAWKVRWGLILLGLLWLVGLLAGALHPLGFVAALVLLGAATWFMVALGTFASLVSRDTAQASNRTLIPALLLMGSFLACVVPTRITTVFLGMASVPLLNWLSLVSYRDAAQSSVGHGAFGPLAEIGIFTGEGPFRVLVAYVLGTAGTAAAAAGLTRAALARFDQAVGRPTRSPAEARGRTSGRQPTSLVGGSSLDLP